MVEIGKRNTLEVVRETDNGFYLDGEELGEILMPKKFITDEIREINKATVFVYTDSEDRLVATTETPKAYVGEFALLKVVETTNFGAFLDWGLPKDLLVPFSGQKAKMKEGGEYVVHIYLDEETGRVAASAKVDHFLDKTTPAYQPGDEVSLFIAEETDLGYKAIVDNSYWGILYRNQLFQPLAIGQQTIGYINKIREDDKIDLLLEKPGYGKVDAISEKILEELRNNNGFMAVSDKTSPDMIKALFGVSKKNFKKAIGNLYKQKQIQFESDGIRLVQ
ncbi:MAG TPA: S1-like domain-containing RNA-binding protein [Prolixibacteraceae bacterium]|nr:S1-like domain-containing RNA-binding protein [Prolixibacteraceae bacterium]